MSNGLSFLNLHFYKCNHHIIFFNVIIKIGQLINVIKNVGGPSCLIIANTSLWIRIYGQDKMNENLDSFLKYIAYVVCEFSVYTS